MTRLGIAVVGAGGHNIATANHLPAIKKIPELNLVLLMDKNPKVKEYAEEYGVEWTLDFDEVLARDDVHIVDICSPDWLHAEQTIKALEAGKHVLCEKPMALSVSDARSMVEVAEKNGRKLQIMANYRYYPEWNYVKQVVDSGQLGRPRHLKYIVQKPFFSYPPDSPYRKKWTGGQFIHNGVHYVDLICYLLGSQPTDVAGMSLSYYPTSDRLETDNYVLCSMLLENGASAVCEMNLCVQPGTPAFERVVVIGEEDNLDVSLMGSSLSEYTGDGYRSVPLPPKEHQEPIRIVIQDFVESILHGKKQTIPPDYSLRIFEGCMATLLAVEEQRTMGLPLAEE
ncbi:MAG TPA: Gfo/Idh/MocA family oxidoreductase [Firmicutes bacterium]|nr:Gfo/Idh/MocA family oxidoreductase [Bacillota bacterium]